MSDAEFIETMGLDSESLEGNVGEMADLVDFDSELDTTQELDLEEEDDNVAAEDNKESEVSEEEDKENKDPLKSDSLDLEVLLFCVSHLSYLIIY